MSNLLNNLELNVMLIKENLNSVIFTLDTEVESLKYGLPAADDPVCVDFLEGLIEKSERLLKQSEVFKNADQVPELKLVKAEDAWFALFERRIKGTNVNSFLLLTNPLPNEDPPHADLKAAVKDIQRIILEEVKDSKEKLKRLDYHNATQIVYDNIRPKLKERADRYGIEDTACREVIMRELSNFFFCICTGNTRVFAYE